MSCVYVVCVCSTAVSDEGGSGGSQSTLSRAVPNGPHFSLPATHTYYLLHPPTHEPVPANSLKKADKT